VVGLNWIWVRWWGNGGVFEFPEECCQGSGRCVGVVRAGRKNFFFRVFTVEVRGREECVYSAAPQMQKEWRGGVFVSGGGMRSGGALV